MALVFEVYGALCFFALVVFLIWAAMAKLRPDLDEEEFDLAELEKLKTLASSEPFSNVVPVEGPIIKHPSRSPSLRKVTQSKRLMRRRPHLIHTRKPRTKYS